MERKLPKGFGVCDVCGKPANILGFDMWRRENPTSEMMEMKHTGIVHRGCSEHPAMPIIIDLGMSWSAPDGLVAWPDEVPDEQTK